MKNILFSLLIAAPLFGQNPCTPPNCGGSGGAQSASVFASALKSDLAVTTGSGIVRIAVLGDSLSYCTTVTCSGISGGPTSVWVDLMRTYLQTKYGNAGSGLIPFRDKVDENTTNPNIVASLTGGTSQGCPINSLFQVGTGFGGDVTGSSCFYIGGASPWTLVSTSQSAASFRFVWQTCCNSAGSDLKIDAVDKGTIMNSTDGTCCTVTSSTVAATGGLGSHTFTLVTNTGTTNGQYMFYAEAITGNNGVAIDNLSMGGARMEFYSAINTAQNGAGSSAAPTPTLAAPFVVWTPAISHTYFIVMLGTNDFIQQNVTTSTGYLNALVSDLVTDYNVPASHILLLSPPYEGPFHTNNVQPNDQSAYTAAAQRVSSQYGSGYLNICLVDSNFCSYYKQNAAGYMTSDVTHMTQTGQNAWWADIKTALGL